MSWIEDLDQDEVEEAHNEATARSIEPSRYPAMSYEEGVRDALGWVTGQSDTNPMEDDE